VSLLVAVLLLAQGMAPLRKSDLVRLLSGSVMTQQEIAHLVSRNCLTFTPTHRDHQDLLRLGAEPEVLAAVAGCARRAAARPPAAAAPRPVRPTPPQPVSLPPPSPSPSPPRPPSVSPERTRFVAGGGQSGPAGTRLPRALVFEARDSAGVPLAGRGVTFTGINARSEPESLATDADGRAQVGVTLGQRVGTATLIAAAGVVEKQASFNVVPGPVTELVISCRSPSLAGHVVLRSDTAVVLRVAARDAYGNPARLTGLRAAVADARIFRVLRIAEDSATGSVTLKSEQAGTTSLAVIANGMRRYWTVTVSPRAAPGRVDCP